MPSDINSVTLVGNLTRDPELRQLPTGTSVCDLGIAVNERFRPKDGEWQERANYFTVVVWGAQGEACAQYLHKGRPVAVQGRLRYESWENKEGDKRSAVKVVADVVKFLNSAGDKPRDERDTDVPADTSDLDPVPVPASGGEDPIPF